MGKGNASFSAAAAASEMRLIFAYISQNLYLCYICVWTSFCGFNLSMGLYTRMVFKCI